MKRRTEWKRKLRRELAAAALAATPAPQLAKRASKKRGKK